jgi:hypothetical protein
MQSSSRPPTDTLVLVKYASNTSTTVKAKQLCIVTTAAGELDRIAIARAIVLDVKAHCRPKTALHYLIPRPYLEVSRRLICLGNIVNAFVIVSINHLYSNTMPRWEG